MHGRDLEQDESLGLNCAWYADILMTLTREATVDFAGDTLLPSARIHIESLDLANALPAYVQPFMIGRQFGILPSQPPRSLPAARCWDRSDPSRRLPLLACDRVDHDRG